MGEETRHEGHAEVGQDHRRDKQDARGNHGRGTSRDEGARPRAEDGRTARLARGQGGRVVCFFQTALKFKSRYATLGFSDQANLDEGAMWPTSYALTELTAADEARIGELVKKAVS
jgi:hypothetical protein